jgi:PAS domain-containing protein
MLRALGDGVQSGLEWAGFLVTRRAAIERALAARLGAAFPRANAPEAEALRRFRSFASARMRRDDAGAPALDGLRVDSFAVARLVDAWCSVAEEFAGGRAAELRSLLGPLRERFRSALLGTEQAHEARRAPRTGRRAVVGAIDRIADAFLAVDVDDGSIADANPAAATLLRVAREELLGVPAASHVAPDAQARWSAELEALAESAVPRRFASQFVDARGDAVAAEIHATRFASRDRVLALLVARVS